MKTKLFPRFFTLLALGAGLIFGTTSCEEELLKVNVPLRYYNTEFVLPTTTEAGPLSDSLDVVTNIDSILNANKVNKDKINSITLKELNLEMVGGDELVNFRLLQSVKAEMSVNGGPYVTLSQLDNNPDEEKFTLNMPVNTSLELKDYLTNSSFRFRLSGVTRGPVAHEVIIKAKLDFVLSAGV